MAFPSSWNSGVKSATTRVKGLHAPCRTYVAASLGAFQKLWANTEVAAFKSTYTLHHSGKLSYHFTFLQKARLFLFFWNTHTVFKAEIFSWVLAACKWPASFLNFTRQARETRQPRESFDAIKKIRPLDKKSGTDLSTPEAITRVLSNLTFPKGTDHSATIKQMRWKK